MDRVAVIAFSMLFKARGGIPRFNQMLCLAMDEIAPDLGLRVKVLSLMDTREDYEACGSPWRHLEFVPCRGKVSLTLRTIAECALARAEFAWIGLLGMSPAGCLASPFTRRGFGLMLHGTEAWDRVPFHERFAAGRARFIFSVSRYTAEAFCRQTRVDPSRIRLLPNTLAPGFEGIPDDAEPGSTVPEILSVGRLWAEQKGKGIDVTLRVFGRIAPRYPTLRYRIVGKGNDLARLKALASSLGVSGRVSFEEDLPDAELADRYRRCSIFVLPSGQEGFGIVFLEAMRFGKPCIGGSPGGTPEVVEDQRTGLIVPFQDEAALEAALDRLLSDADLRRRMGEAGRRRLEERFTFARFRALVEGYTREWLARP